ncbi:LysM peptidoglycan-binding domain-containing protein [Calidifontibacillus erzurumensis]|uniref:LysM peptidoglycan-binding domain-containing protein n=1 Tax=Calidifontibacillus erzurumensis TaxID=2741433 RepID=A0A8J8KAC3_9BACI|nr:LysM domain-containing protein [Calidifontibacillus erzurumensis]NSL50497.1 LysM peptidoglycan-binding domain-containing protein [Calidifontibacillus erzurumensis]
MTENFESIDQAESLRKQMEKIDSEIESVKDFLEETSTPLPPRSEVHRKKRKKMKMKIQHPLVRLLGLTFILIVCLVATFQLWKDKIQVEQTSKQQESMEDEKTFDIFEMNQSGSDGIEDIGLNQLKEKDAKETDLPTETVTPDGREMENTNQDAPAENKEKNDINNSTDRSNIHNTTESKGENILYHRVKAGETLYRISMKYYHSRAGEEIIKRANRLDANGTVYTGQLLKIPLR